MATDHRLRHWIVRVLGPAGGRDLPQAGDGLACPGGLCDGDPGLRQPASDTPAADGCLGPRVPVRHLQPSGLGQQHSLPVPVLSTKGQMWPIFLENSCAILIANGYTVDDPV